MSRPLVADVDMCGVSTAEFALLLVIAIIVMGPERLPEALRGLGKLARQLRGMTGELGKVQDDIRNEFRKNVPIDDIKKKVQADIGMQKMRESHKEIESEIDAIRARIKSAKPAGLIANDATPERTLDADKQSAAESDDDAAPGSSSLHATVADPAAPNTAAAAPISATPAPTKPGLATPTTAASNSAAPATLDPLRYRASSGGAAGQSIPSPKPISQRNAGALPPTPFERAHTAPTKPPVPAVTAPPTLPTTDDGDDRAN